VLDFTIRSARIRTCYSQWLRTFSVDGSDAKAIKKLEKV